MFLLNFNLKYFCAHGLVGYLSPDPHWNANDHCGDGDSSDQRDSNRRPDKCPQLPQDLFLPTPRLLSPESTARGTKQTKTKQTIMYCINCNQSSY